MAPIDGVTPRLSQETPVLHNSPAMAPRLSRRLARTFLVVSPLVLAALACTPVPSTPTTEADEANGPVEILTRTVPDASATLTFPPGPEGRHPRPALEIAGTDETDPNTGFRVQQPQLEEGTGKFDVEGRTVRVVFNRPVKLPKPVKNNKPVPVGAGVVTIEPAVAGKAVWTSINTLEFTATKPFDPEQTYTISVAGVSANDDVGLEKPWIAKFTAEPRIEVAGKVLTYLPTVGEPGIVEVFPYSGSRLSATSSVFVVFDQPVTAKKAAKLVHLWTNKVPDHEQKPGQETEIPVTVANPASGRLQGYTLNPRQIIEVKGASPLPAGQSLTLIVDDGRPGHDAVNYNYEVAGPLQLKTVSCGYSYERSLCQWDSPLLRTDGREVVVEYTNRLAIEDKQLKTELQVTPPVANLNVWGGGSWDSAGRLSISGAFEPSSRYTIAIPELKDRYGNTTAAMELSVATAPLAASVSMPEGVLILDGQASRTFTVTTRNVARGKLLAWLVQDDAEALNKARNQVEQHEVPSETAAIEIPFSPEAKENEFVKTSVDLLASLSPGKNYILSLVLDAPAFDALPVKYPSWMSASRSPLTLVTPGDERAIAVHTHVTPEATLVHVARLSTGEPVPGASFSLNGKDLDGKSTDANGFATLPVGTGQVDTGLLMVKDGETTLQVPLKPGNRDARLFPQYAAESAPATGDRRALVITDRGIYRPGSKVFIKASVRRKLGEQIVPLASTPVRLRVLGPTDDELADLALVTDDMGSVAGEYQIPAEARVGRHRIEVAEASAAETVLAEDVIQVAEFEPPRFTVDVDASVAASNTLRAKVLGKYLFGAAMDGAGVDWTLDREDASLPGGPFTDAGFHFTDGRYNWWDEEQERGWSRAGHGELGPDGILAVTQKLDLGGATGPQKFTFEADVADSSYRHIAGRGSVVVHPTAHYVGLKITKPWGDVGVAVPVQLGVIDHEGRPVAGVPVTAKLNLVDWTYSRKPRKGGGYEYQWQRTVKPMGSCSTVSAQAAVSCDLTPTENGSYEVISEADGKAGGVRSMWAWGGGGARKAVPTRGRTLDIIADKGRYVPGETAKLLVQNPFPAATAIFTLEQGGLLSHQVLRLDEAAKVFEVPILAGHAPHVHATITLLPIGGGDERTDWKIGAIRLPVAMDDVRLSADVRSDRTTYEPGEQVTVTIDVKDGKQAIAGAEIALAVVDEGILRMTNFHAADPAVALRPGQPLRFSVSDTRDRLAALLEHSQTAGDGAGDGSSTTNNARKNFVQTAYWKPDLRTDSQGRATATFTLPDNLTRFRMMAVVIDKAGKGVGAESEFTVRRPVMMVPVVPRFAAVGDSFEVAAMLHNNTDQPLSARVLLNDREQAVTVKPQGHERVGFPLTAQAPGELKLDFSVKDASDKVRDAVIAKIPVDLAGVRERPQLSGAFVGEQRIKMEIPTTVLVGRGDDEFVTVQVGQHLWPELGARMQFLLDYPHGCVEQTTSGTLPLLAAKDILPRIGFTGLSQAELDKRIDAGLSRLATMRTASGGLGYWPGDSTPNIYGTAYAARAVVAARRAGIRLPDGLLKSVEDYLLERLLSDGIEGEVQASIALSLGELGSLPASSADALYDRRGDQGVFGKSNLAIALSTLSGQEDRVKVLLDEVEAAFDAEGKLVKDRRASDFYYYGSDTRSRAQAAIALGRLRPGTTLQTKLVQALAASTDSYTTQSTAFSLMAVAEQIRGLPQGGAEFSVTLGGDALTAAKDLGGGSKEFQIPLTQLRGEDKLLTLRSDSKAALAFIVRAGWKRELDDARGLAATSAAGGPDIYRVITDARGEAVDLAAIKPGTVLRVALLADLPIGQLDSSQMNYLAVTDRLPAGFEPIQPDLWTVARAPELSDKHPFADMMRWGGSDASYVELRDDRVQVYFDRVWGERVLATYLVRASTPGTFVLPPAAAEFMYVGDSLGYSSTGSVTVKK
jgi:uncharacterized protein YfaS (alpha-2-macroglobulin family)